MVTDDVKITMMRVGELYRTLFRFVAVFIDCGHGCYESVTQTRRFNVILRVVALCLLRASRNARCDFVIFSDTASYRKLSLAVFIDDHHGRHESAAAQRMCEVFNAILRVAAMCTCQASKNARCDSVIFSDTASYRKLSLALFALGGHECHESVSQT
jgi:hypothetical protein